MTTINNDNIREFVHWYVNDKSRLPRDLIELPIGNWKVGNVTNMSGLFYDYNDFNEPLEKWNVSNVTDMSHMFHGCRIFISKTNKTRRTKKRKE